VAHGSLLRSALAAGIGTDCGLSVPERQGDEKRALRMPNVDGSLIFDPFAHQASRGAMR